MKVLVAMSGGVDSSVAAALLLGDGHEVTGATMKLWGGASDTGCCAASDVDDARRVAQQLGIDYFVFNFGDDFGEHVVDRYVADHAAGRTPNPCVECNRHIKFDRLMRRAEQLGFDAVATGHHARIVEHQGRRYVARGADAVKDQSYVLYMLDAGQLAKTLFPVGSMTKDAVRSMAADLRLRTAAKADSQDVCFIHTRRGRAGFLGDRLPLTPGRVVDRGGAEVGSVDAVELVTVGQRRGLDMGGSAQRQFALDVDVVSRTVTVGGAEQLLVERTDVRAVRWTADVPSGELRVQTSAHGDPNPAHVTVDGAVRWQTPQRRVAPGQIVVYYDADRVVGGAIAA